jgi:polyhydroxybutyrate depolymerase
LLVATPALAACSPGGGAGARNAGGPDRATTEADATPADCDPPRRAVTTDAAQSFRFGDQDRAYLLALPDGYDGTTAQPLVFSFHGFAGSKEGHDANTAMADKGTARGYIVVTPDALGAPRDWNYLGSPARADDFGFVDALVVDLSERLCVDADRVYAAGHSAGSAFAGFVQCKRPYRFVAVAMVAAFIPTTCPVDDATPSVIALHGTADPAVPYDGGSVGGGPVGIPPVLETLQQYADAYGCDRPATEEEPAPGVETDTFTGCAGGSEVVLTTIVGGGHGWPGSPTRPAASGGEAYSATDAILDFFDAHPLTADAGGDHA